MKRILFYIVLWLIPTMALADVNHLPKRTIENVADGVIVTYQFDNPIIRPNPLVPGSFLWQYAGFGMNDISGEPALPFRTDMFYIPAGHKTEIMLLKATYKDMTLVLSPAISNPPDDGSAIVIDSIRPYTGFYPNSILKCDTLQSYRGIGLQNVSIIPIQYNYNQHKIRAYKEIKYKVSFIHDDVNNESKKRISDITSSFLSNVTLNYTPSAIRNDSTWHTDSIERNYLIITTTEYGGAIQNFVKWKRLKGNKVYTAMLPKGSWTTDYVKDYVEAFLDNMDIHYLLIIGGNDDVPGVPFTYSNRDKNNNVYTYYAVTDYEYGIPDITDGVPQIYRGRITGDYVSEITAALNKIIQYEKEPTMDNSFYKTSLHCGEYQDRNTSYDIEDGYEDRAFILTSENILNHLAIENINIYRQYATEASISPFHWSTKYSNGNVLPAYLQPENFSWNGNADSIRAIINNGVFYILYCGHGGTVSWENPYFWNYDMSLLQNGNKLPVIFSLACLNGKYNTLAVSFVENALKKANGGCVGIFAASEVSFSGYTDALALGMFDAIWPNLQLTYPFAYYSSYSNTPTPTYELGQILDQGLFRMGETYGLYGSKKLVTYKLFHCFGDPSMRIYTETPQYFAEPLIFSRGDSIFVFVEDGDCKITFYDKFTEEVKSYKGNYAAYANPSDSLVICLDRHNYVPYIWDYTKDVYIQNENIHGETRVYTGSTIYVGNHVTATKPTGDVYIQNSNITIHGERLELQPGTRIDRNFNFHNR